MAVSARNFAATQELPWPAGTSRSFTGPLSSYDRTASPYSDGYVLRPSIAVPTVEAPTARTAAALASAQASSPAPVSAPVEPAQVEPAALQGEVLLDEVLVADEALAASEALAADEAEHSAGAEQRGPVHYEVAPGDTVSTIAESFGISSETILAANSLSNANFVKIGQSLLILPVDGVMYTVQKGDSLLSVASWYGVDTEAILGYGANEISNPDSLSIGQELIIPGGRIPAARASASASTRGGTRSAETAPAAAAQPAPVQAAPAAAPVGSFIWPNSGRITQYFGGSHSGLDIAAPAGTPVVAADGGVVVDAQKLSWGLGWYITIDHGNGLMTTYAHLSSFAVGYGERVSQGQMIGRVGSTGLSTGPHNHFVVIRNGVRVNPLSYLP